MELIKENLQKKRRVYKKDNQYLKVWDDVKPEWIADHVKMLSIVVPGYVISHGPNWIEYKVIPGVPASTVPHSDDFILKMYNFCVNNIVKTAPYAHGDWVLSNILIDGDNITMCDWDNLGIYSEEEIFAKMNKDLWSAFGDQYLKVTGYDPSGF
jgi:RIO-like serine/threonine protein kinase